MTHTTKTSADADRVVRIRRADIEPDPKQPRMNADADLRASIAANGIKQPIVVRPHPDKKGKFIIVDGERRWRGSDGVLEELPARIDDREMSRADLLIAQATFNFSKPLTPLEEAVLFSALVKHGLSQQQIEERMGVPRSTVGDRIRMLELDSVWIELLREGKIQVSHTPKLHKYRAIPSKYQRDVAERFLKDYRAQRYLKDRKEPVPVDDFESIVHAEFARHLRELGTDWPKDAEKYEGPTLTLNEYGRPTKYAADPDIWRPLIRRAAAARAKANKAGRVGGTAEEKRPWLKLPEGAKEKKIGGSAYSDSTPSGHVTIVGSHGHWEVSSYRGKPFDPDVLLEHLDPEKIYKCIRDHGAPSVTTTDTAAHGRAVSAFMEKLKARQDELLAAAGKKIAQRVASSSKVKVDGGGTILLMRSIAELEAGPSLHAVAIAIGMTPPAMKVDQYDRADIKPFVKWVDGLKVFEASQLATAWAAAVDLKLTHLATGLAEARRELIGQMQKRAVRWGCIGKPAASKDAKPATCIICDCTDNVACAGGCSWLVVSRTPEGGRGVCDNCAANAEEAKELLNTHTVAELHKDTPTGKRALAQITKARKGRAALGPPAGYNGDEDGEEAEEAGWGDGTRDDLWDSPGDGDEEDLEDEDLAGDELVEEEEEPAEAAHR